MSQFKKITLVGLVLTVLAVVWANHRDDKQSTQPTKTSRVPGKGVATEPGLVPPLMDINHEFESVAELPQVTPDQLRKSADIILSLRDHRFLQTPADKELMVLLEEYVNNRRRIHWSLEPEFIATEHQAVGFMAYSCTEDTFTVGPAQSSTQFIALVFYHELQHAWDCVKHMRAKGLTEHAQVGKLYSVDLVGFERTAYAAQVRFFAALYDTGRLPTQVSAGKHGDTGILDLVIEVWYALARDQFNEWYHRTKSVDPHQDQPMFIKDLGPK